MRPKNPLQVPRLAEIQSGRKFWGYLDTVALQSRYVLAAHYVRKARHIVEVGGYRGNVITNFLTGQHESVTVYSLDAEFEPLAQDTLNGAACRVRHVADFFQNGKHPTEGLGVVALGLEIHGNVAPLIDLIQASQVAVLEIPEGHAPSAECLRQVLAAVSHQLTCQINLDLSYNESLLREELRSTNMNIPFWRRQLYVLGDGDPPLEASDANGDSQQRQTAANSQYSDRPTLENHAMQGRGIAERIFLPQLDRRPVGCIDRHD